VATGKIKLLKVLTTDVSLIIIEDCIELVLSEVYRVIFPNSSGVNKIASPSAGILSPHLSLPPLILESVPKNTNSA
ncbi:hypothetical protein L9F63_012728, partial [Diploptera punctata]